MDFPVALGIRLNIPQQDLRDSRLRSRWHVTLYRTKACLDLFGEPHPEVGGNGRHPQPGPNRTLEGRWWRRDVGGKMVALRGVS